MANHHSEQARLARGRRQTLLLDTAMSDAGFRSTHELALAAGVNPATLYRFRQGHTTKFNMSTQVALARVLPGLFGKKTLSKAEFAEASKQFRQSLRPSPNNGKKDR